MEKLRYIILITVFAIGCKAYGVNYVTDGVVVNIMDDYTYNYTTSEMKLLEDTLVKSYEMVEWDTMWPSCKKDGSTIKKLGDFKTYIHDTFNGIDKLSARLSGKRLWLDYYVKQDGSIVCKAIRTYEYDLLKYASTDMIKQMIKLLCEYKFKEASVKNKYCLHLHTIVHF